ncbi:MULTISPECIES: CaiB/BaiF CoA transferase family protein [unclassified Sphingomonas]|uniref:CaiB/BaiF CoA transferase family protein n=1 Tax=unclassified Sphingomonas TaxID=196159 RepID=UPI0006FB7B9D|nr:MULTISPECIES: CaiB/BaiF CoA-transferase family protein [unclassified Sphingomonas]KQX19615.1 carnitine dehydratase [Sphingomonas sp. Root1294]KQY65816.1 carnitine dehydratase [Sphingomonas sp. Root50]KRB94877.1 carnitine dehydratase [Sphingomonas sp. Root720]
MSSGPLAGLRVLELAGIGPAPLACMILADYGADVIRVERRGSETERSDQTVRGRRIVSANLKDPAELDDVLDLIADADILIEGYRPGVTERLGLGPADCLSRNPRLIYGRITGWGQVGSLASSAGHDINYISITGVLENIGRAGERPVPPLNMVGDYGGGAMFLIAGVLAALFERQKSGRGQVVDAAMCDGTAVLAQLMWSMRGEGQWSDQRGSNLVDGSRPYYDTYVCADGRCVAVGCIEPQFFAVMVQRLGLDQGALPEQNDSSRADELRAALAAAFATRTMSEWADVFAGTDACVTPVLTYAEALENQHFRDRETFTRIDGVDQPRPAPRFSRTPWAEPIAARREDRVAWFST